MLLELNIENFAIIENMKIEFESGLNVLTGETGSGKSIIIDSLGLVLGQRANKDIIKKARTGPLLRQFFLLMMKKLGIFSLNMELIQET